MICSQREWRPRLLWALRSPDQLLALHSGTLLG